MDASCQLIPKGGPLGFRFFECGISRQFVLLCNSEEIHFFVDFPLVGGDTYAITSTPKNLECSLKHIAPIVDGDKAHKIILEVGTVNLTTERHIKQLVRAAQPVRHSPHLRGLLRLCVSG